MNTVTAIIFVEELKKHRSESEHEKIRQYFKADDPENRVIGVRMKTTFDLAKKCMDMPLNEIANLIKSPYYEARMGAVSIMDFRVQSKNISEAEYKQIFELYLNNHNWINNWDFVDRAAPRVIGGYLHRFNQPRDVIYRLAESGNPWERRTAIVSTGYFIQKKELDHTFRIASILAGDNHEFVQKAIGTWLRHAGKQNREKLSGFLEKHAPVMSRIALNIAIEKFNPEQKSYFRKLNN